MKFTEMLRRRWEGADSLLCVGLDPNPARFPKALQGAERPIFDFCREIVDATADLVCAFKPQIAYFASRRAEAELEDLIAYIHEAHPGIPVILDAKRGDIGSTAEHYALEAFERFGADCTTVAPYMGFDAVEPSLRHPEKGAFILCRTSNKSGDELQMLSLGEERLFEHVARLVAGPWNRTGELEEKCTACIIESTFFPSVRECLTRETTADEIYFTLPWSKIDIRHITFHYIPVRTIQPECLASIRIKLIQQYMTEACLFHTQS